MFYLISLLLLINTFLNPPLALAKCSLKKGISGPGGCPNVPQLNQFQRQIDISWFYTWASCPDRNSYWNTDAEYVPMIRSVHNYNRDRIQRIVNQRNYQGKYWLVGNEPDVYNQDDLTYDQAAEKYGEITYLIKQVDPTAKIIMLGLGTPNDWWKKQFVRAWRRRWPTSSYDSLEEVIDGWHVHLYGHPQGNETWTQARTRLKGYVNGWINANPDKELWITEFGNLRIRDPEAMTDLTNFFEQNPKINRYAYFYFGDQIDDWQRTSLYDSNPQWPSLTSLGSLYASLPQNPQSSCAVPPAPTTTNTPTTGPNREPPLSIPTNTPATIPTPTPTNPPIPTNTLIPSNCPSLEGTLNEAELWRSEYIEGETGAINRNNWQADFIGTANEGCDGFVDIDDFEAWRNKYILNLQN